jgi:membrane protein YqaA with SNARE-associated domain
MTEFLDTFLKFILSFGLAGVFVLATIDSTFLFFLPFALDAVLIILVSRNREWMPLYALVAVAGSFAGCATTYFLLRKASEETLKKKFPKKKFNRVKKKVKDNGFAGLIIASLLPPPFPFTPFVVAAAIMDLPKKKAFAAISIGRTLRYFLEGFLALLLGRQILKILDSQPFKIFMFGLFILAAVGTGVSIYKWVRK